MLNNQPIKIEPGFYTIVYSNGEHRTLQVKYGKSGFLKGQKLIGYLSGSDNTRSYTWVGVLDNNGHFHIWNTWLDRVNNDTTKAARFRRAVEIIASNPEETGKAYALNSGNCYRCNRLLTHPDSILSGIGPECSKRDQRRKVLEAMAA